MLRTIIAVYALMIGGVGDAAERQREFNNTDIERVMRENPGLSAQPAPARSVTVYRCKKPSGAILWADGPCHTIEASTMDLYHVPATLNFAERVRHAQAAHQQKYPAPPPPQAGPTAQQKFDECQELKGRLAALWRRSRESYPHLSTPLKNRQKQLGCD